MKTKTLVIFISRKGRRTSNANYAAAEVVAGYARQRAQRRTEDEDNKTISQKDDKTHNVPSVHIILLYLALSRKAQNLCSIFANSERKTGNNPPPPLRSSPLSQGDSKLLLANAKQDGTTQCDAIFIYCPRGVLSSSVLSPFFLRWADIVSVLTLSSLLPLGNSNKFNYCFPPCRST